MEAMKKTLVDQIKHQSLSSPQQKDWAKIEDNFHNGFDLESALDAVKDQDLLKIITKIAGNYVASVDREYAFRIAQGSAEWPATLFVKKLVDSLPEGDPVLHALSPKA